MFWGAWYSGVKWHSPFSTAWIEAVLNAPLPSWVTMVIAMLAFGFVWALVVLRRSGQRASERINQLESREADLLKEVTAYTAYRDDAEKLRMRVKEFEQSEPKLHGVWNNSQTFWGLGRKGQESMMQIGGWIDLTSSNTDEMINLLAAYINEQRSDIFLPVEVIPGTVNHVQVVLYMVPPLQTDENKPFTTTVVVEDQYNRKYNLPTHTFRGASAKAGMPLTGSPATQLHIAWRSSGWCWIMHEGENVLRISGDGTFLLDNARESVIFTGVRIEGGEYVGTFDNFELTPSQPVFRGLNIDVSFRETRKTDPL